MVSGTHTPHGNSDQQHQTLMSNGNKASMSFKGGNKKTGGSRNTPLNGNTPSNMINSGLLTPTK